MRASQLALTQLCTDGHRTGWDGQWPMARDRGGCTLTQESEIVDIFNKKEQDLTDATS